MVMPFPVAQPSDVAVQPLVFSATPGPSSVANPFVASPQVGPQVAAIPVSSLGGFGNIWGPPLASPAEKKGSESECLIRLPFGICLLNRKQGESILGGLLIAAGGFIALAGLATIVASLLIRASFVPTPTFIPVPVARAMGVRPRRRRVIETPDQAPIASS
jgi:hypothetical protein